MFHPIQDPQTPLSPGGEYLDMEEDELNQHESMAAMVGVIKHMAANNIIPQLAPVSSSSLYQNCYLTKTCPASEQLQMLTHTENIILHLRRFSGGKNKSQIGH